MFPFILINYICIQQELYCQLRTAAHGEEGREETCLNVEVCKSCKLCIMN